MVVAWWLHGGCVRSCMGEWMRGHVRGCMRLQVIKMLN